MPTRNRWTRVGVKSGPCNTLDGRWRLSRFIGGGRWEVLDLRTLKPAVGAPMFPNITTGRQWLDLHAVELEAAAPAEEVAAS